MLTCVYYTANSEAPAFEGRICEALRDTLGDVPLVSVSQRPLGRMGQNICVGQQHWCDGNALRQLRLGVAAATTPFVVVAEADALYPPAYFAFEPPKVDVVYRYQPVYILHLWRGERCRYEPKVYSECAQIVGRDHWLRALDRVIGDGPEWVGADDDIHLKQPMWVFPPREYVPFSGPEPVVNMKTGRGLRPKTTVVKGAEPLDSVPRWGRVDDVRRTFTEGW